MIIVGDHSVSLYGLFIFNSQNTHAVYRSKENLNYIFGADFKLTAAIKFEHNAAVLKQWLILKKLIQSLKYIMKV